MQVPGGQTEVVDAERSPPQSWRGAEEFAHKLVLVSVITINHEDFRAFGTSCPFISCVGIEKGLDGEPKQENA
jgi:hypothetical protein